MDAEFQSIFGMSCESRFRATLDEVGRQLRANAGRARRTAEKLAAFAR